MAGRSTVVYRSVCSNSGGTKPFEWPNLRCLLGLLLSNSFGELLNKNQDVDEVDKKIYNFVDLALHSNLDRVKAVELHELMDGRAERHCTMEHAIILKKN